MVDIGGRQIPAGRMAGLQRPDGRARVGDHETVMRDPDMARTRLGDGGARVGPDTFLTGADGIGFGLRHVGITWRDASGSPTNASAVPPYSVAE